MIFGAFHDDRGFWHLTLCRVKVRWDRAVSRVNGWFVDSHSTHVCRQCLRKANELRGPQRGDS